MAQGRFTSRTIAIDPKLGLLSETAELLYLKAIPHLDRDGLCTGDPYGLLGMISPLRFSQLQGKIAGCIDEWILRDLVIRYQTSLGPVLMFLGFSKQQKLQYDREAPSQFAAPPGYVRTNKGLVKATDVPWTSDSGFLTKNPESEAKTPESRPQAEAEGKAKAEGKAEAQSEQQAEGAPPAAASEESEIRDALNAFGITGKVVNELAPRCSLDAVLGWIEYAGTQERLNNPKGYVIARLRSGDPPPDTGPPEPETDSYEALRRRYLPPSWEDIIEH